MDFLIVNHGRRILRERRRNPHLGICIALDLVTLSTLVFAAWWFHGAYFGA